MQSTFLGTLTYFRSLIFKVEKIIFKNSASYQWKLPAAPANINLSLEMQKFNLLSRSSNPLLLQSIQANSFQIRKDERTPKSALDVNFYTESYVFIQLKASSLKKKNSTTNESQTMDKHNKNCVSHESKVKKKK